MKRFFYHGTSADNLPYILKNGLSINETKLWTCSEDGIYLWDSLRLAEANGKDLIEDANYIEDDAFNMANESGQIACAAANNCKVVVIKVLIDDSEVEIDYSCPNMENSGAVVIYRDILLSEIVEIKVSNDLSLLKGYFINIIKDMDYCNLDFTPIERKIADSFKHAEIYPEDIHDLLEWENIEINSLQVK